MIFPFIASKILFPLFNTVAMGFHLGYTSAYKLTFSTCDSVMSLVLEINWSRPKITLWRCTAAEYGWSLFLGVGKVSSVKLVTCQVQCIVYNSNVIGIGVQLGINLSITLRIQ